MEGRRWGGKGRNKPEEDWKEMEKGGGWKEEQRERNERRKGRRGERRDRENNKKREEGRKNGRN